MARSDFNYDREFTARFYTLFMPMLSVHSSSHGELATEIHEKCYVPGACQDFPAGTLELASETALNSSIPVGFIYFADKD